MSDRFAWTTGQLAVLDLVPQADGPETDFEAATRVASALGWVVESVPGTRHNEPGSHPEWNGFSSHHDADAWALAQGEHFRANINEDQRIGIQVFKSNDYTRVNRYLREGGSGSTFTKGDTIANHARFAHEALRRDDARIARNVVTYRGMSSEHVADNFDKIKVGHQFSDPGFNSTSFNPSIAQSFALGTVGGIVLKVHLPRGTHAAYTDHPSLDRDGFGESEMLLPPGTKYEVLRARYDKQGRRVLSVKVVDDNAGGPGKPSTSSKRAPLLSTPEGAAPEFVHDGSDAPNARPERFGVSSADLDGADDMVYLEEETRSARARSSTRHNAPGDHPVGREFASVADGDEWGRSSQQSFRDGLSSSQTAALQAYKREDQTYAYMNDLLRTGREPRNFHEKGIVKQTQRITEAFAQDGATIDREVVTYRGVNSQRIADDFDKIGPGLEFTDAGFGSTSMNPQVAARFAAAVPGKNGVILRTIVPQGSRAIYAEPFEVDKASSNNESELLLPPGTRYRTVRASLDEQGRKVLVVEVVADPSEQRRAFPALRTETIPPGASALDARVERFGVVDSDLEVDFDQWFGPADATRRARATFVPTGSTAVPPVAAPSVGPDDVTEAVADWDEQLPDYAGLLEAEVVDE